MKVLNIIRSKPDDMTSKCIESFSEDDGARVISLYEKDVDWSGLVDEIFAHDKIVCWW